ncbi:hypothetical protein [Promicromonospora iranensis]|uniref:Membrane protein n=1 Tax=Promicromonospora iranensis TaxID=1105144 RepID=A0ABU2CTD3_9MICO|nr:hypothetical protein [Promicromonospora iranensis]MDR7384603.1 putative membrane protein [Promicromonospora iranensis]
MSNTYGGWNPQDPYRGQNPESRPEQDPDPGPAWPPQPQPFDPYGPRDPYGRPANPYGRPDYQPQQQPEQRDGQPGVWGQFQTRPQAPQPQAAPGVPQYSPVSGAEHRPGADGPPTIGGAWRWGWGAFGASWGVWVLMSLLLGLAQLAVVLMFSPATVDGIRFATDPAAVDAAQAAGQTLEARGLAAAGTAVCFLLQALLYAGAIAATRTRKVRFRDFFVLRGFGGLVGYAVITGALGFAGSVVPVFGWLVQLVFTLLLLPVPFLLLKGEGFGKALGGGIGLVLSHLGTALAVFGIFAGLALASLFTCGIGLVVVAPAMLLVGAYLVQRWTGETVQGRPSGNNSAIAHA